MIDFGQDMIDNMYLSLRGIYDMENIFRKSVLGKITPRDFYLIYESIKNTMGLVSHLSLGTYFQESLNINHIQDKCNDIISFLDDNLIIQSCSMLDYNTFENKWCFSMECDEDQSNDDAVDGEIDENSSASIGFINSETYTEYKEVLDDKSGLRKSLFDLIGVLNDYIKRFEKRTQETNYVKIHHTPKQGLCLLITKKRAKNLQYELEDLGSSVVYESNDGTKYHANEIKFKNHTSKNEMMIVGSEIDSLIEKIMKNNEEFGEKTQDCYNTVCKEFESLYESYQEIYSICY